MSAQPPFCATIVMYSQLDAVGDAERRAEALAFQDRLRYVPFFKEAERFAAENGLVIGGEAATRLLLGGPDDPPPLTLDSFQCDFYSGHAVAHARALGDAAHAVDPEGLGHYTAVLAKVAGHSYEVAVDGRPLFTVTALPAHRGVQTAKVVIPTERPAQFARDAGGRPLRVACMGPEIQLMRVYATLCDPGQADAWGRLLETEASLRALHGREARAKIAEAVARAAGGAAGGGRARFMRAVYESYAAGPDRVLVGPAALALLRGRGADLGARLQVVAAGSLEAEAQELAALAKRHGLDAQWAVNDPKIPTDPRLRRLTLYLAEGRRREPLLDVFNAAGHELVPYAKLGGSSGGGGDGGGGWQPPRLKVGTPFAIMRFRLADMWTVQVLMQMGAVEAGYARGLLHGMLADFEAAAAHYEQALAGGAAPEQLLPVTAYVGRLEDAGLALRRAAQNQPKPRFYPPYYPAASRH